jgi:hypothetical protein
MFNVGDTVIIASADKLQSCEDEYGYIYCAEIMQGYAGRTAKIVEAFHGCRYHLDVDNRTWFWTKQWLMPNDAEPFDAQSSAAVDQLFN